MKNLAMPLSNVMRCWSNLSALMVMQSKICWRNGNPSSTIAQQVFQVEVWHAWHQHHPVHKILLRVWETPPQECQNSHWKILLPKQRCYPHNWSFVAITNHLTNDVTNHFGNDVNKEELFIAKAKERRTKAQENLARIESDKRRGEFVEEKKISEEVTNF